MKTEAKETAPTMTPAKEAANRAIALARAIGATSTRAKGVKNPHPKGSCLWSAFKAEQALNRAKAVADTESRLANDVSALLASIDADKNGHRWSVKIAGENANLRSEVASMMGVGLTPERARERLASASVE